MSRSHQLDRRVEDVEKAMKELRRTMRATQIRTAGFKKHHDTAARSVATVLTRLEDAAPLTEKTTKRRRTR
ncbi:hypothetical protein [Qaidamihabitans albus]|uniref:hypothetical protein n=1 Tax=Qaidamihabitans albus TaxID=2795733 RepID=UPI0018F14CD4|nr:hypothetical protein [Qaidamihabitans albus]